MKIAAKTHFWTNTPLRAWLQPLCAVAALVLVAGADELHQLWLPGRMAGWDDWFADVAGITLALTGWRWLGRGVAID